MTESAWYSHHGGKCPVINEDVNVMFAHGGVMHRIPARLLASMPSAGIKKDFWTGVGVIPSGRIVAYQICDGTRDELMLKAAGGPC